MDSLRFSADRGLSHAYIAAARSEAGRQAMADVLSAAAVCSGSGTRPCGQCRDCRKARDGVHPDILHIRREPGDNGKLRKEIRVDQIREMIAQAQVMPNEAAGKAFVIHEAETMNQNAQNALLKLLEEPPRGVVLILSTAAPGQLLPTVRSRCVELSANDAPPALDEAAERLALEYLDRVRRGSPSALLAWCNETGARLDNAGALAFTEAVRTVVTDMLCGRRQDGKLPRTGAWRALALMEDCQRYLAVNTGIKHLFGVIAVKSIGADEAP